MVYLCKLSENCIKALQIVFYKLKNILMISCRWVGLQKYIFSLSFQASLQFILKRFRWKGVRFSETTVTSGFHQISLAPPTWLKPQCNSQCVTLYCPSFSPQLSSTLRIKVTKPSSYHEAKQAAVEYHAAKQTLIKAFQKAGLGAWVKKPIEQDQFSLSS